ncbi:MAG: extracellular solute-binding protein [Propionibacteriaceae bacterium]|jgi:arabinogalactan oligomer/maltooligosaccharide transport system substrate-binding protein|nr:extracellular solute-binding protein [Propionibacteriaceae bacterium]
MRKTIALIGATLIALGGLAACSGSGSGSGSGSETTAGGAAGGETTTVTLKVWGPSAEQVDSNSWLPVQEKAFEAAHPDYKITWQNSVVSEADAGSTVTQDPSAAADVYLFANDQLGTIAEAGAIGLLPPDAEAQVEEQNSDVMITSVTSDGQLYGVPYTANTWFMYYNKSKFTEDDIKSLDTMLEKGIVSFPLDNSWYIAAFYAGNGGTLFGADGTDESAGINFGGDAGAAVTTYLVNLYNNPNFVVDTGGSGIAGLKNGTIDAMFSGSWDAQNVQEALGDNYAAAKPPTFTVDGKAVQMKAFAGSKAAAYNPKSANAKIAAEFAAWLGSTDAQKSHYELNGVIPSDASLASDSAIAADPVALAQIATVESASILQPTVPKMGNFWTPAENFGKSIISKEVTVDNAAEKTEAFNAAMNA